MKFRDVRSRVCYCGSDLVRFLKKNSDLIWNEFGSFRFEKCSSVWAVIVTYYLCNS